MQFTTMRLFRQNDRNQQKSTGLLHAHISRPILKMVDMMGNPDACQI